MSASMRNIKLVVSSDDIFSIQPFPHPEPLAEIPGAISAIKPLNIPIAIKIKTNNIFITPIPLTDKNLAYSIESMKYCFYLSVNRI